MNLRRLLIPGLLLVFLSLTSGSIAQAPLSFSLKQAQEYAYENNFMVRNSALDVQIARKIVKENTAIGLPQIDASISYMDYIERPTSLIPGEFFGQPGEDIAIQFGTKYNANFTATLTQLVYSGQYIVGLQTAKSYLELERQRYENVKIDIRDQVSIAYIAYFIIEENLEILDSTYAAMSKMVDETRELFKNGLVEQMDVEQLELNMANLEADLESSNTSRLYAYNFLKYLVGVADNQEIILTDSLSGFLDRINRDYLMNTPFDYNQNITYRLFKKQEYLVNMQLKLAKTAYHPTLAGFLNFAEDAQRNSWNFFDSGEPWYMTANWGLQLNIPIWSSGSRKFSIDQAKLEVEKMKVNDEQLKTNLKLEVETARNNFNKSYLVYLNKRQGLQLAGRIYDQSIIKYSSGLASSTDLDQKYNQFLQAQREYIGALSDLLVAHIQLNKLLEKV